jgi:Holliday junction resolvasome RuvABC ATP-dependent DNA helicase subunit
VSDEKLTEEQMINKLTDDILGVLKHMSQVVIVFKDSMHKLKFYHTEQSLNNVLEHISLDIQEINRMQETCKEAKK